jgi:mycothiol synthase
VLPIGSKYPTPSGQLEVPGLTAGKAQMITYGWGRGIARWPDVSTLRAEAAAYDAEQGFVPLSPRDSIDDPDVWELLVQRRRHAENVGHQRIWRNAAYLSVTADGDAEFVVRPEFRSVGVATSLVEKLGTEPEESGSEGLGVRRIRIWAHGSHPAADRMAKRFGLVADRAEVELVVPMASARKWWTGNAPVAIDALDQRHHRAYLEANVGAGKDASEEAIRLAARDDLGVVLGIVVARRGGRAGGEATIECVHVREQHRRRGIARSLLERMLLELGDSGIRLTRIVVGEKDHLFPMLRSLGWRHDQTNLRFTVGLGELSARPTSEGTTTP